MKPPKYTDAHRFPNGPYVPANSTNVAKTIAREKERLKSLQNVIPIRKEKTHG